MIGIHPVHRRMAELTIINTKRKLNLDEQSELFHCMQVNAKIVSELDHLKQLAFIAHEMGDMDWEMELCGRIEKVEVKMI